MIKKTITYVDYNDQERTEDFYFNLTQAEIVEWHTDTPGGLADYVRKITSEQNHASIVKMFKELVLKSYGEKSPDGRRFMKSEAIAEAFSQTEAYSQIFMELAQSAELAAEFVNGIASRKAAVRPPVLAKQSSKL